MDRKEPPLTASEIATYVVCPEAWRLKRSVSSRDHQKGGSSYELRRKWIDDQGISFQLRRYAKVVYALLVLVVVTIFLLDHYREISRRSGAGASTYRLQSQ
jgi:hypothetical protein